MAMPHRRQDRNGSLHWVNYHLWEENRTIGSIAVGFSIRGEVQTTEEKRMRHKLSVHVQYFSLRSDEQS